MKINCLIKSQLNIQSSIKTLGAIQNPLAAATLLNAIQGSGAPDAASWAAINGIGQPDSGSVNQLGSSWGGVAILGPSGPIPFRLVQANHRVQLISQVIPHAGFGFIDIFSGQLYAQGSWYVDGSTGRGNIDIDVTTRYATAFNTGGFDAYVPFEINSSLNANGTTNFVQGYDKKFRSGPGAVGGLIGTVQEQLPLTYPNIVTLDIGIRNNFSGISVPQQAAVNGLATLFQASLLSQYILDVDDVAIANAGQNNQRVYLVKGNNSGGLLYYGEVLDSSVTPDYIVQDNAGARSFADTTIDFVALDKADIAGFSYSTSVGPVTVKDSFGGADWSAVNPVSIDKTIGVSTINTPIPYEPKV